MMIKVLELLISAVIFFAIVFFSIFFKDLCLRCEEYNSILCGLLTVVITLAATGGIYTLIFG
ncbi:MAG: hypothetical protein MJ215_01920 [Spirochaetia bacterium]|nr:hypothetical protein [Spirochaetia bacterium]